MPFGMQGKCRTSPLRATGGVCLKIPRRCGIAASPRRTPASVLVRKHKAPEYPGCFLQGLLGSACCHARDGKFARTPELSQARDRAGRARPDHPTSQPPGAGLLGRRRGRGRSAGSARPDLRVRRRGIMDHWSRGPKRRRHRLRARRNVRLSAAADPLLKFACMRRPGAIASRLGASRA
jgi:hypothetical protein